jgi:hypothetical protein
MTEESGVSFPPQVVSLDLELALLSGATRGAETLADLLAQDGLDGRMKRDAPTGIFSILALVRNRIELLRRCIRNEMDPAHLWAPHNAVEDPAVSGDFPEDIILFSRESHRAPMIMWGVRVEGREPQRRKVTIPGDSSAPEDDRKEPGKSPSPPII